MTVELLKKRAAKELKQLGQSNHGELDIEFKRAELAQAESVLDRLSSRVVALSDGKPRPEPGDEAARGARAQPTGRRLSRQGTRRRDGGACLGLPFAIAVLLELIRHRIRSSENLREISHLPVLGEISQLPRRSVRGRLGASPRSTYLFEESFNALRTKLILSEDWKDAHVFAVTSRGQQRRQDQRLFATGDEHGAIAEPQGTAGGLRHAASGFAQILRPRPFLQG